MRLEALRPPYPSSLPGPELVRSSSPSYDHCRWDRTLVPSPKSRRRRDRIRFNTFYSTIDKRGPSDTNLGQEFLTGEVGG